jgi:hypothetical protein
MPAKNNINPNEFKKLRREVKILLIDKGLDLRGGQTFLAEQLGVYRKTLNSAITGYLNTPGCFRMLENAREYLIHLPNVN